VLLVVSGIIIISLGTVTISRSGSGWVVFGLTGRGILGCIHVRNVVITCVRRVVFVQLWYGLVGAGAGGCMVLLVVEFVDAMLIASSSVSWSV